MHTFRISPKEQKFRLDRYLTERFPRWSRSHLKILIDEGLVLVSGQQKKAGYRLRPGDEIVIQPRGPQHPDVTPEDIPLNILYEDKSLLVINKPAGLVVHPAAGNWQGTLVNALLYHVQKLSSGGDRYRPGIVHRLDKGTSGVMVIAKTNEVHRSLAGQFKYHKVKKIYHALVFRPFQSPQGTIHKAIGRDPKHRLKFSSQGSKIRDAVTHFKVVESFQDVTLLELTPQTGRTHQLRVHLSEAKHPIVGDTIYGAGSYLAGVKNSEARERLQGMNRPALHAAKLGFTHPETARYVEFEAPWPEDFRSLVNYFQKKKS